MVLQYPSKRELIEELKKGSDYVGITFIMAVIPNCCCWPARFIITDIRTNSLT